MWFKRYDVQEAFNMYGTKVPVFIVVPQFNDSVHHYFCAAWPSLLKARFDSDRRFSFISLVNSDTRKAGGVFPSIFLGIQIFGPGEHIVAHRHSSYALYHILQGEGCSVLDGQRFEWETGDTFACPPMASHEHINIGTVPVIQYVIQDMPARAMERNLIWEEPIGNVFQVVEGSVPHQTT